MSFPGDSAGPSASRASLTCAAKKPGAALCVEPVRVRDEDLEASPAGALGAARGRIQRRRACFSSESVCAASVRRNVLKRGVDTPASARLVVDPRDLRSRYLMGPSG